MDTILPSEKYLDGDGIGNGESEVINRRSASVMVKREREREVMSGKHVQGKIPERYMSALSPSARKHEKP